MPRIPRFGEDVFVLMLISGRAIVGKEITVDLLPSLNTVRETLSPTLL